MHVDFTSVRIGLFAEIQYCSCSSRRTFHVAAQIKPVFDLVVVRAFLEVLLDPEGDENESRRQPDQEQ